MNYSKRVVYSVNAAGIMATISVGLSQQLVRDGRDCFRPTTDCALLLLW